MSYVIRDSTGMYWSTIRGWVAWVNDATITTDAVWATRIAADLGADLVRYGSA
jgi:DhnA family fructose-bisphosphate aldolase class Ia